MLFGICDDDEQYLALLEKGICQWDTSAVIKKFSNAREMLGCFDRFDAVLIDIEMPEMDGFKLAENLADRGSCIIFVSHLDEKVYESLRYRPLRFIRKSCIDTELTEALEAVKTIVEEKSKIFTYVTVDRVLKSLRADSIIYLESEFHTVKIVCQQETFKIYRSLKNMEQEYAAYGFIRVQSGFIVNIRHILSMKSGMLKMANGVEISIGRDRREAVKTAYMDYMRTRGGM